MTWETDNPVAVVDEEVDPPVVVIRYRTLPQAEWYLGYLRDNGGTFLRDKVERGGYGIDVTAENSRNRSREKVAHRPPMDYNRVNAKPLKATTPKGKANTMPPRGRRASAAPAAPVEPEETEEQAEQGLYDHHLTKNLTATMTDYAEWFHENVADIDELGKNDPGRLLALGSTLYPHFQKSELNQSRREARRSERAAAVEEPEEEAPAPPARKGRAAAPAAKVPAPKAPARGAAKPAPARGRGRATAEAPY